MTPPRTYYDILGVPHDASPSHIKRKFRQLAQKYHPDVAADKELAHRVFIEISEAYEALNDTARRRAYDENISRQAARNAERASQTRSTHTRNDGVSKLLADAQYAFVQRRFNEAVGLCKQALAIDGHNARAHAMLGDIYRVQGKTSGAIRAYSYALQYNPSDTETEMKLIKLVSKQTNMHKAESVHLPLNKSLIVMNVCWCGLVLFLLLLLGPHPGKAIPWLRYYVPQISNWSWNLVAMVALASAVTGFALAINGLVANPDEELVFEGGSNWAVVPAGLILLLGSGIFFLGAAGFYLLVSLLQGSLSKSVLMVFSCVTAIVLLAALTFDQAAVKQVLLFGGNVSFLPMLIGWHIGAFFQPLNVGR